MDRVVYLLGAGFSAPLGLPVMNNFYAKSKDMREEHPERYADFKRVFDAFDSMSRAMLYFDLDLFNIEEILSIMEMDEQLGVGTSRQAVSQYIRDVVEYFTPPIQPYGNDWPSNWYNVLFGHDSKQTFYGYFVGNLLNLHFKGNRIHEGGPLKIHGERVPDPRVSYSVITLNYDLVIENYIKFLNANFRTGIEIKAGYSAGAEDAVPANAFPIAKLPGSVDTEIVVAPTWNKTLDEKVRSAWRLAYSLLAEANHIRIIGYSLPVADAYVKYLLKAASLKIDNLKSIHIVCLDEDGAIQARYNELFKFKGYRFLNRDVEQYLQLNYQTHNQLEITRRESPMSPVTLATLEQAHNSFFAGG